MSVEVGQRLRALAESYARDAGVLRRDGLSDQAVIMEAVRDELRSVASALVATHPCSRSWPCESLPLPGREERVFVHHKTCEQYTPTPVSSRMAPADHPHLDPGDGRPECPTCGKYVWPAIHSCKGVPVTEAARRRAREGA